MYPDHLSDYKAFILNALERVTLRIHWIFLYPHVINRRGPIVHLQPCMPFNLSNSSNTQTKRLPCGNDR